MKKTKDVIAKRIYELSQRIKGDQDEMAELREALAAKMKPGQVVPFDTPEGPFRAKLCEGLETVLKDNGQIELVIGTDLFLKHAKMGISCLKEAIKERAVEPAHEAMLLKECTKAIVTITTLKILKGRER